jgi:hypothetical protein
VESSSAGLDAIDDGQPVERVHIDTVDDEREIAAVVEGQTDLPHGVLEHLHAAVVRRRLDALSEPRGRDGRVDPDRVGPSHRCGP